MNYFGSFGSSDSDALSVMMPVIDHLLEAHQSGDYDTFSSLITPSLQKKIPRERFLKAHEEIQPTLGKLTAKRFLGSLNRKGNVMLVLLVNYDVCEDDVLVNITFENNSSPPKVDWIWIE